MLGTLTVAGALVMGALPAQAVVVDFDDLVGSGLVSDGYGGINWNGEWQHYDLVQGDQYVPHSPDQRIYRTTGTSSASFDFLSDSVFAGAWFNGTDLAGGIFFELFLDGNLVHTSDMFLLPSVVEITSVSSFFASGYGGLVDRVTVHSELTGAYFIIDDVTFDAVSVPEPASLVLLAGGLAGAALLRRRVRRG
jgi:hypothetical protein